ncbi:Gamma-aminobutyrate permease [Dermatophilus congolensis]|uniref:Gamma-aminobutyrate permease n=1 Tax=Dermatophilus congolensis TaxID=1863 RepID=A0AA46BMM6_9MICO|nr:amino acid permease [Dermatophilus congolensis]STD07543.1 Gamma-aminobutyrate permease [Dermatophilus congolensis]
MSSEHPSTAASPSASAGTMNSRHLVMMSLGSAIGAGLFVGSGAGITAAGPAVLVSYLAAGIVVMLIMRMLGEMVAENPSSGAFSVYAERALGPAVGFAMGWLWWLQLVVVIAAEATAAAQILVGIWGGVPQWALALIFMVLFTLINLTGAKNFGEFEFWFALVKVGAVIAFLLIGVALLVGLLPVPSPGLTNLTAHGGFAPQGLGGITAGLLVVIFAFGGIEIVAVAAADSDDPSANIARAMHTILWRILAFYMGSVAIMVLVLPWNSPDLAGTPFVAVLDHAGLPAAALIMGLIVVIALLSALNANLYGASRMIHSLAERGYAPKRLTRINNRGVPVAAVFVSVAFGFVAVFLNYVWAEKILLILLNIVGATIIVTWAVTICSHIVLRRQLEKEGKRPRLPMWCFPWLSYAALVALAGVVVLGMSAPDVRVQFLGTAAAMAVLVGVGVVFTRNRARENA